MIVALHQQRTKGEHGQAVGGALFSSDRCGCGRALRLPLCSLGFAGGGMWRAGMEGGRKREKGMLVWVGGWMGGAGWGGGVVVAESGGGENDKATGWREVRGHCTNIAVTVMIGSGESLSIPDLCLFKAFVWWVVRTHLCVCARCYCFCSLEGSVSQ